MSRLEEKLKELGYTLQTENREENILLVYCKCINPSSDKIKIITWENIKVYEYYLESHRIIEIQEHIDEVQQAFNVMQKDLEVLKQCQS